MKNRKKSFIFILILLFFSGCSLLPEQNLYICIYDCDHGTLEVKVKEETKDYIDFLIIPHPETGYTLNEKNLIIYNYDHKGWIDYIKPDYIEEENYFIFSSEKENRITISAFFTKISME